MGNPIVKSSIMVAVYWPDESSYGIPRMAETMNQAVGFASDLVKQGYGVGKSRVHIIETTREITEWQYAGERADG